MINLTPQTQYPAILPSAAFWYTADKQPLGAVSSWAGQLFNNPATQGTAANQPVNTANLIGGKPSLLFDGTNDLLTASPTALNSNLFATGGTIAGVFRPTGAGGSSLGRIYDKADGGTTAGNLVVHDSSTNQLRFLIYFTGQNEWASVANTLNLNNSYFFIITYDSSSVSNNPTLYLNSTSPVTFTNISRGTGTAPSDSARNFCIGNRTDGTRTFNGYISELMGFRTILTGTNLNLLINYFRLKYGL